MHNMVIQKFIQQLLKDSQQENIWDESAGKIESLTPIIQVDEGAAVALKLENSFLAEMASQPDVMPKIIVSEELYPFYLNLNSEEFVARLNKTIFDYIRDKVLEEKQYDSWDDESVWYKPNKAFFNWFQENGIDEQKIIPLLKSDEPKLEEKINWRDHSIAFVKAENSVPFVRLISPNIKDGSLKHPYDWGLYRSQSEPNKVYEMLLLFATRGKNLNPLDYSDIDQNTFSQRINRCNQWLMKIFNLNEKPIQRYSKKRVGYSSRIKITYQERKKGKDGLDFTDSNYDNPDLPTTETDNYRDNTDDFESDDYLNK